MVQVCAGVLPGGEEEDAADGEVGQQHEEPNGRRERVQEGEVTRFPTLKHNDTAESQRATTATAQVWKLLLLSEPKSSQKTPDFKELLTAVCKLPVTEALVSCFRFGEAGPSFEEKHVLTCCFVFSGKPVVCGLSPAVTQVVLSSSKTNAVAH